MTPEEYNAQLQALQAKRSIANAMLTSSIAQGQNWGGDRFAHSPLEAIANLGSTYFNKQAVNNADKATQSATASRQAEIADALTKYQSATPDAQVGQQALENIRGTPDGQIAQPVTSQSSALKGLGRVALGPDQMAQMAVQQAMTPHKLTSVAPGASLIDEQTHAPIYTAPEKPPEDYVDYVDAGDRRNPVSHRTGASIAGLPAMTKGMTPAGAAADAKRPAGFTDAGADVLAALAAKGVSLPTGLRSKEQQIATVNALIRKFPDATPDEIATRVAKGQVDFGAIKKETQTAAAQAGRVAIATNELKTFAPLVLKASAAVPRGNFVPITQLMQMGDKSISDPNLKRLKISINSMLNAYDQLASRGGTDVNKRAEAHALLTSAESPEALEAGIEMFKIEADAAGQAADSAEQYRDADTPPNAPPAAAPPLTNAKGWVLHQDAKGNKAYVSPDGKSIEEVK